ncbi:hypothetical protein JCM18916_447 [Cutibacterium acnes JCM 18916]|nr:hypothetical protein JCM18916_447 [Cutibacterium acnes JCM 18916]
MVASVVLEKDVLVGIEDDGLIVVDPTSRPIRRSCASGGIALPMCASMSPFHHRGNHFAAVGGLFFQPSH